MLPSTSLAVILTTNSWVGGRNNVLGACYIAVGGLCLIAALFFVVGYDMGGCCCSTLLCISGAKPAAQSHHESFLSEHSASSLLRCQHAALSTWPRPPALLSGLIWKRPFGDLANLSWLRSHASEIHTQRQLLAALSSTAAGNGTASHAAASADGHAPAAQQVADVPPSVSKN